jgi:hypothetical protein
VANPPVRTFAELIQWLADQYHGGHPHPMHERLDCSPALVQFWAHGSIKQPSIRLLYRLCEAYGLDLAFVLGLFRQRPTPKGGAKVARPIRGGSGDPVSPSAVNGLDALSLIGRWWTRAWGWLLGPAGTSPAPGGLAPCGA